MRVSQSSGPLLQYLRSLTDLGSWTHENAPTIRLCTHRNLGFYVTRRGRLRELFGEFGRKRKGVIVFEKLLVLHDYVRSLRGWR